MSGHQLAGPCTKRIGIPFHRVNRIVRGERAVTADIALRLARLFGTTAEFWLNLQQAWDLYEALHSPAAREIAAIAPINLADRAFRGTFAAVLRHHDHTFELLAEHDRKGRRRRRQPLAADSVKR